MVGYRRNKPDNPDAEFFITIVTQNRKRWFSSNSDLELVRKDMGVIRERYDLKLIAWAILPEHIHLLMAPGQADYSKVIYSLKKRISYYYRKRGLIPKGGRFWQDRFWEHTIRDEDDRMRCVEYIHYNSVKHGVVKAPRDWKYSSFHRYVERRIYPVDWGDGEEVVVAGAEYDL